MKKIASSIIVVVALAAAGMHAQGTAPAGNAGNGKAVFIKAKCFSCHGTMGQGGPGGRLAPRPVPFAAFRTFVRQGKVNSPTVNRNWNGMPPFSTRFISDAELADIYAYLSSIPEPPPTSSIPLLASP
jgi:mono/diheme cytochrome c family protein